MSVFTLSRQGSRQVWVGLLLLILSLGIFLLGIAQPPAPYFDEQAYVPAARQILHPQAGETILNREHPPLAKALIAIGIAVAGDTPTGWRLMSAVFGALALCGVFAWARVVFKSTEAAVWAAVITLVNQLLYVHARIAMLDVFALAFTVWAFVAFSATWTCVRHERLLFAVVGVLLGLSTACKWTGVFPWVAFIVVVAVMKALQRWQTRFEAASPDDWYRPDLWSSVKSWHLALCLGAIPAAVYLATFVVIRHETLAAALAEQVEIWREQHQVGTTHPYMSSWPTWPFIARPIWYLFEPGSKDGAIAAVVALGNPVVLWTGIAAIVACGHGWLIRRRADAFLVLLAYGATYLVWALVPRPIAFFYYYLPATTVLALALAYLFFRTPFGARAWTRYGFAALAVVSFLYFLPITAPFVGTSLAGYSARIWFPSWR